MDNTLDLNLQLYDNVQTMEQMGSPDRVGRNNNSYLGSQNPERGAASPFTAAKSMGMSQGGNNASPLRKSALQQSIYPMG